MTTGRTSIIAGLLVGRDGPRFADVSIDGVRVADVSYSVAQAGGDSRILAPGFVDLQVNGGWGMDFTAAPSTIWDVGERLTAHGVTSFLPTIVTAPYDVTAEAIAVMEAGPPSGYRGAKPLGLHIEGPWISPEWSGAHNRAHLAVPDVEVARDWAMSGLVAMVTIAPELSGAGEAARVLAEQGVVVAAGHSGADYETAVDAFDGSWDMATHLYNQMSPFRHRAPGMVGAVLSSRPFTGLIADGLHCHPAAARLAWDRLGHERVVLVTDAMAATGLQPGDYHLGDVDVTVDSDGPRTSDGRLAGSVLTMDEAVRNMSIWTGADATSVLAAATRTPAAALARRDIGRVKVGETADLAVLSPRLEVLETVVRGEVVFTSG